MNKTIRVMTKNGVASKSTRERMKIWHEMGYKIVILDLSDEQHHGGVKIDKMWVDEISS